VRRDFLLLFSQSHWIVWNAFTMCYYVFHKINEELTLPPVRDYRYPPPPPLLEDVLVGVRLPRLVEDNVASPADAYWTPSDPEPPVHEEPLFVEGGVAVYVSRGRAFRGPVPPPPLPPLGHGAAGVPSVQWPGPSVGRGRAAGNAAIMRLLQSRGRSRN